MHKSTMIASCMITLTYSGHKTWWIHEGGCRQAPSSLENAQLCDLYDCIILIGSQAVMYSWEKYRQTPLNLLDGQISKNCFLYDHLYQIASYKTSWIHGRSCKQDPLENSSSSSSSLEDSLWARLLLIHCEECTITSSHSLCTNWVEYGNLIRFS